MRRHTLATASGITRAARYTTYLHLRDEFDRRRDPLSESGALLDTLEVVLRMPDVVPVVAMTGDLTRAQRGDEVVEMLASCRVIPQRGNDFATRLANAHRDVGRLCPRQWVFQIGMDTPHLTATLLTEAIDLLHSADAVLGPATDGGWWGLGLRNPQWAGCCVR